MGTIYVVKGSQRRIQIRQETHYESHPAGHFTLATYLWAEETIVSQAKQRKKCVFVQKPNARLYFWLVRGYTADLFHPVSITSLTDFQRLYQHEHLRGQPNRR